MVLRASHISMGRRIFSSSPYPRKEIHQFISVEYYQLIHLMEHPIDGKKFFSMAFPEISLITLFSKMGILGLICGSTASFIRP